MLFWWLGEWGVGEGQWMVDRGLLWEYEEIRYFSAMMGKLEFVSTEAGVGRSGSLSLNTKVS